MKATIRIAWIAVRELVYEKVFYILLCFAALSLGISLMLGQLTYAEQSKLTIDFMLGGIELSMILFSIFMGISLFQREMTLGSVAMVLSKPISRSSFLIGKFLGQIFVQAMVIAAMSVILISIAARSPEGGSFAPLLQCVFLINLEVTILTAITYFFAVNSGAITASVATFFLFCIGHLGDTFSRELASRPEFSIWQFVKTLVPDLEIFNMKALASYGLSVDGAQLGWAGLYAACCVGFFLILALVCFQHRDIQT